MIKSTTPTPQAVEPELNMKTPTELSSDPSASELELSCLFDQYAAAMDAGDLVLADDILQQYPSLSTGFRTQIQGLYLLGKSSLEQQVLEPPVHETGSRRLGDFEIEQELGRGGMGIVYAARQISLQRRVPLKILPFTAVLDPRQVARFRNEAQAAASLHHSNIVPVYGVGCERGIHYYSMQLIEGQSLEQFLTQLRGQNQFEVESVTRNSTAAAKSTIQSVRSAHYLQKIVEIGACAAAALHYAHEHGVVHRDIKPSNLLLDPTGQVFVTDFGLARCQGHLGLTSQGERLGTIRYMSPEQATGKAHEVDFRTDIYSLGVTLYELLTLTGPFPEENRQDLLQAIEAGKFQSIRKRNPAISVDLETVVNKAMATAPQDRYDSAQSLADDLFRCLSGTPVFARRPSRRDRAAKWLGKHHRFVLALSAVLLAVSITSIAVALVINGLWNRERQSAEDARFYLRQANRMVERFGNLAVAETEGLDGQDPTRSHWLSEAITYHQDFLQYANQQPSLAWERIESTTQLARLLAIAGQDRVAIEEFDHALEQLQAIESQTDLRQGLTIEILLSRALNLNQQGLAFQRLGEQTTAERNFRSAIQVFSLLENKTELAPNMLAAFAQTHANLGRLLAIRALRTEAQASFERALLILERAGENLRSDSVLTSTFFKIQGNYFSLLVAHNPQVAVLKLPAVIEQLEAAQLDIKRLRPIEHNGLLPAPLLEMTRENAIHVADLKNNLAVALSHLGRYRAAKSPADSANSFWKSEFERDSNDLLACEHLATTENTLGEIAWRLEAFDEAKSRFETSQQGLMELMKVRPNRPEWSSRLGTVLHNQSLLAAKRGSIADALRLIREANANQGRALSLDPGNPEYMRLAILHQQVESSLSKIEQQSSPASIENHSNVNVPLTEIGSK